MLAAAKTKAVFYMHNISLAGMVLIADLVACEIAFNTVLDDGNLYGITICARGLTVSFRCSHHLIPASLKKITLSLQLGAVFTQPEDFILKNSLLWEGPIDVKYFEDAESFAAYNKILSIKSYISFSCENNAFLLSVFLEKIFIILNKDLKLNVPQKNILTSAALGNYCFFKIFNKNKIPQQISTDAETYIKNAFFGGRCEVFGNPMQEEFIYHYDFEGMYGQCMAEANVFGQPSFQTFPAGETNNKLQPGFYNIDWESANYLPVLPHHNVITGKLLFTNGLGNGTYWFEEIELFKQTGGKVLKVNSSLVYGSVDYVFKDFVHYFNGLKQKNIVYKLFGKSIINGFYGKTGLQNRETSTLLLKNTAELTTVLKLSDTQEIDILRITELNNIFFLTIRLRKNLFEIFKKINIKITPTRPTTANVAIAASIAAKARNKLYNALRGVINSGGRILYCDTDSIFASFKESRDNTQCGEIFWDTAKQNTKIRRAVFIGPKSYALEYVDNAQITKIKGRPQNSLTYDELALAFYKKKGPCNINLEQILTEDYKLYKKNANKRINLTCYDKRVFSENKKNTQPLKHVAGTYTTGI